MFGDERLSRYRHSDKARPVSPEKAVKRRTVQYLSDCGKIIAIVGDSPDAITELILLLGRVGTLQAEMAVELGVTTNSIYRWSNRDMMPRKKSNIRAYIAGLNRVLGRKIAKLEAEL